MERSQLVIFSNIASLKDIRYSCPSETLRRILKYLIYIHSLITYRIS